MFEVRTRSLGALKTIPGAFAMEGGMEAVNYSSELGEVISSSFWSESLVSAAGRSLTIAGALLLLQGILEMFSGKRHSVFPRPIE